MQLCLNKMQMMTTSCRLGSSVMSQHENYTGPILNNGCLPTPKKATIILPVFMWCSQVKDTHMLWLRACVKSPLWFCSMSPLTHHSLTTSMLTLEFMSRISGSEPQQHTEWKTFRNLFVMHCWRASFSSVAPLLLFWSRSSSKSLCCMTKLKTH